MKILSWLKLVLFVLGALAIGIQFVPVSRVNPPITKELAWDSPATKALAKRACFDCHSNEVRWPWYSYVAPMSWMITQDVKDARESFNYSEVSPDDRADILAKHIESGEMPLPRYKALHPAARLTDEERKQLINSLRRSFEATRFP